MQRAEGHGAVTGPTQPCRYRVINHRAGPMTHSHSADINKREDAKIKGETAIQQYSVRDTVQRVQYGNLHTYSGTGTKNIRLGERWICHGINGRRWLLAEKKEGKKKEKEK